MRKANVFVNAAMKLRLGGEEVVSILEACRAVDDARREALEEVASKIEDWAAEAEAEGGYEDKIEAGNLRHQASVIRGWIDEIKRLSEQPVSGGAND